MTLTARFFSESRLIFTTLHSVRSSKFGLFMSAGSTAVWGLAFAPISQAKNWQYPQYTQAWIVAPYSFL